MKSLSDIREYIEKHFNYNPETGQLTRTDRNNSNGSFDGDGYLIIKIKTKQYKAHRICWLLYYGEDPNFVIDHINGVTNDNRIKNLRKSDAQRNAVNNVNVKPNEITGHKGIYIDNCTKGLKKKYTTRFLGKTYRFYTLEEAVNFKEAKKQNLLEGKNET